ncbi:MATE family efflux transporter [Zavarzinia compransoris]|uniref:MATE family efflux transporter n=1 Tax=Zavarzinia marina TaxID=2911065 RepID=UPI001F3B9E2F|nr:MATE family efflux transporter [Zavarzinia marina]MCF4165800.1 MATE family efflux transporter [Zavarzinia marina]
MAVAVETVGKRARRGGEPKGFLAEARALLVVGLPLVFGQLAWMAMLTTDTVILGRLGPESLAAGALGHSVVIVPMLFLIGLAQGAVPLMAHAVGARTRHVREVRRTVRQAFWATGMICVPAIAALWFVGDLLLLIGQDPALVDLTEDYVRAVAPMLLTYTWFAVLRNFTATYRRQRAALIIALAQVPVNGVLAYGLVFGDFGLPRLGVIGAGVASSLSGLTALIALGLYLRTDRQFRRFRLLGRFWRPDWPRLGHVFRIGTPIGLTITFEVLLYSGAAQLMGLIGPLALAAHQIALQVASVTFMVALGIGQAGAIRVGIATGARDPAAVGRTGWTALVLGCGFMGSMAIVMVVWRSEIAGLFLPDVTSPENREVVAIAAGFLILAGVFQVLDAAQVVTVNLLRGLRDARVPMLYALLCYWVLGLGLSWLLAFPLGLGGMGIWWSFVAALAVFASLLVHRFAHRDRLTTYRDLFGGAA